MSNDKNNAAPSTMADAVRSYLRGNSTPSSVTSTNNTATSVSIAPTTLDDVHEQILNEAYRTIKRGSSYPTATEMAALQAAVERRTTMMNGPGALRVGDTHHNVALGALHGRMDFAGIAATFSKRIWGIIKANGQVHVLILTHEGSPVILSDDPEHFPSDALMNKLRLLA